MKRVLLALAAAMALFVAAPIATAPAQAAETSPIVAGSVAERAAVTAEYARWRRHRYYRRHFYRPRYYRPRHFYHRRYYRPRHYYRPYRYYRPAGYRRYYW
jgi:hypothetical protein